MIISRLQRIGIVLSILWALGAAFMERNKQVEYGQKAVDLSFQICTDSPSFKIEQCLDERAKNFDLWMTPQWSNIAFAALTPVFLGWLLGFICIKTYRWIKAGPR